MVRSSTYDFVGQGLQGHEYQCNIKLPHNILFAFILVCRNIKGESFGHDYWQEKTI